MARGPESPLPDPEHLGIEGLDADAVMNRVREVLLDDLAHNYIKANPDLREVAIERQAGEQALGVEAQGEAMRQVREDEARDRARREADFPWGVAGLRGRREGEPLTEDDAREELAQLYARLNRGAEGAKESSEEREYRERVLSDMAHEDRQFTLGIGELVAKRLNEEGIAPNVEIFVQGKPKTKTQWFAFDRYGGDKMRRKIEVPTYSPYDDDGHPNEGWMLPLKGASGVQYAVLLKDGSILITNGRKTAAENRVKRQDPDAKRRLRDGEGFDMDRLDILPNQERHMKSQTKKEMSYAARAMRKEPARQLMRERVYSQILGEELHTDIGLPNMPSIGASLYHHHLMEDERRGEAPPSVRLSTEEAQAFINRDRNMRRALINLLVENNVRTGYEEDDTEEY